MREPRMKCLAAAMMAALVPFVGAAQSDATSKTETRVESKEIPYVVTYELSRLVSGGRLLTSVHGQPGHLTSTYQVNFNDGKPVSKTLISTRREEPVDEVVLMGMGAVSTSRHKFTRRRILDMSATAYDPSPQTLPHSTGRTANGMRAGFGVVAVDPRVIPLGTMVFVEGYGFAIAADTGGAIKGHRIDLCFDGRSSALQFGRRRVKVHVLQGT